MAECERCRTYCAGSHWLTAGINLNRFRAFELQKNLQLFRTDGKWGKFRCDQFVRFINKPFENNRMNMLLDFSPTFKSTVFAENNGPFNIKNNIYIYIYICVCVCVCVCVYQTLDVKCLSYLLRTHVGIIEIKPVYFPTFLDISQKSFMIWITGFLHQKSLHFSP